MTVLGSIKNRSEIMFIGARAESSGSTLPSSEVPVSGSSTLLPSSSFVASSSSVPYSSSVAPSSVMASSSSLAPSSSVRASFASIAEDREAASSSIAMSSTVSSARPSGSSPSPENGEFEDISSGVSTASGSSASSTSAAASSTITSTSLSDSTPSRSSLPSSAIATSETATTPELSSTSIRASSGVASAHRQQSTVDVSISSAAEISSTTAEQYSFTTPSFSASQQSTVLEKSESTILQSAATLANSVQTSPSNHDPAIETSDVTSTGVEQTSSTDAPVHTGSPGPGAPKSVEPVGGASFLDNQGQVAGVFVAVGVVSILLICCLFALLRRRRRRQAQQRRVRWLSNIPRPSNSYHDDDNNDDTGSIDPFADPRPAPAPPMTQIAEPASASVTQPLFSAPMTSASAALQQLTPQREGGIVVPTLYMPPTHERRQEVESPFHDRFNIALDSRASSPSLYPPSNHTLDETTEEEPPVNQGPPARPPKSVLRGGLFQALYQPLTPPHSSAGYSDVSEEPTSPISMLMRTQRSKEEVIRRKTLLDVRPRDRADSGSSADGPRAF